MGLDWECIALPLTADPVRAIRADPGLWEAASTRPPFFDEPEDGPLPQISLDLLAALPDGADWICHFGSRSFHQAEYLLDPASHRQIQTWEEREETLPYRIIHGDETFAEHAQGGQGPLWRCSTTEFLTDAVRYIDNLDPAVVRQQFSVTEMADLGVYKIHRNESDDHAFNRILGDLRGYADICRNTVAQDLDLIISLW
jgi:hypothetical protein